MWSSVRLRPNHSATQYILQVKRAHLFPLSDKGFHFFEPWLRFLMSAHLCETEHDVSQQLAEVSVVLCISRILSITLSFKGIPCANATAWWTGRSGIAMALSYDERRGDTVRYKSDVAVGVIAHGSAHVKLRVRPRNHNMFTRTADDAGRKFSVGQRGWDGDGVAIGEGSDLLRDLREEQNHRFVRVGLWLLVAFDGDCGRKETSLRVICKTISRNSQRRFQGKRTKTRIPSVSPFQLSDDSLSNFSACERYTKICLSEESP